MKQIKKAQSLLAEANHELDKALEKIEQMQTCEKSFDNFSGQIEGNRIYLAWTGEGEKKVELQYYAPGFHREWQFNLSDFKSLPTISDNEESIGFGISDIKYFRVRAKIEGEVIKTIDVKKKDDVEPETPVEKKPIFFGYWDSEQVPTTDHQNIYKVYLQDSQEYAQHGKIIPFISGFDSDMSESAIRQRLSDRKSQIDRVKDSVEFVLLHDEPFYKNFTPEHQELILKCAKEEIGDYKYGFSYARGALVDQPDQDRRIPDNLDVAMVNYYPLYHIDYIEKHEWWAMWIKKQSEFNADLERVLDKVKAVPEVYLTGQSHKSDGSRDMKYKQPENDTVQWYVDACYKYGLKGVVWWLWQSRSRSIGLEDMPELYEEHKSVFDSIITP